MNKDRHFGHIVSTTMLLLSAILLASCSSASATVPTNTPTPAPTATPDPKQALLGFWTSTVTKEDVLRVVPDFLMEYLCENIGTFTWKFNADGTYVLDQTALSGCPAPVKPHIEDKWSIDGNLLTLAKDTADQEVYEWAVNGDNLTFKHISGECVPCQAINTANPWKRVK